MNEWQTLLLLTLVGLFYRVLHFVVFANMILPELDATRYIRLGRNFASGGFSRVLDDYWPPLYPLMLGVVSFFVDDLVLPAIIISTVAGSLVVALTYYFVKQSYGKAPAVVAAVIAIFYPFLINSVFALGSENLYALFILGALIVGWNGFVKQAPWDYLLCGVLLGLAYLTRPEAAGYTIFLIGLAVGKALWKGNASDRRLVMQVASLVLGFALLSAPYIFYLKNETGRWTISGKTTQNFASGVFDDEELQQVPGEDSAPRPPRVGKYTPKEVVVNFIYSLRLSQTIIDQLVPMFLLLLAGLGLFGESWSRGRLMREGYLLGFCLLTVLGYAATWVVARYLYVLLPIFFGWIALGIIRLEGWFTESRVNWKFGRYLPRIEYRAFVAGTLAVIFLYVFSANFFVRSKESELQGRAYEERDAGTWLRENGKPYPLIFSASFRPIFFADGERYATKTKDLEEIVKQIRDARVDYVIDSERMQRASPYLKGLGEFLKRQPDFELVYQRNDRPGYAISIFRLK